MDFVVLEGDTPVELVQVCADLSDPATRERELRAIEEAAAETGVRMATLVTLRDQGTLEVAGTEVRIEPAWRWLLERSGAIRG